MLCGFLYYWVVNLVLISAVLSADSGRSFFTIARENITQTTAPFAFMASAALTLVVLWQREPALSIALVGPLLAIALYQRSTFKAMRAMRLALTDPLTGLGNHRSFHERLQRELVQAETDGTSLALCLVDFDDLKSINDRFGHPVGDVVLGQVASRLRQGGEAFRLGGDEFAVLLPRQDERQATAVARSIVERVAALDVEGVGPVTVSAGVATYPTHGSGRDELIRLADSALYWAKKDGKNRVHAYAAESMLRANLDQLADTPDRRAQYRAAESLAKAVDDRDAYAGSHSQRVGDYAARIARRLGADERAVELARLAGNLHDLGKLAIPEEILRKPSTLSDAERLMLERHPQIGFKMLESLGAEPVAEWVLHHHERWDGAGYPNRLSGDQIPLGARIVFVADAYDAMTSERAYRSARDKQDALAELERCSGTQFDPAVVRALADELHPTAELRHCARLVALSRNGSAAGCGGGVRSSRRRCCHDDALVHHLADPRPRRFARAAAVRSRERLGRDTARRRRPRPRRTPRPEKLAKLTLRSLDIELRRPQSAVSGRLRAVLAVDPGSVWLRSRRASAAEPVACGSRVRGQPQRSTWVSEPHADVRR